MSGRQSSSTDTIVKTVLIFFISLLSFSIGTFVGKKFSDNQHKLAALEPQGPGEEKASLNEAEVDVDTDLPAEAMTAEEEAQGESLVSDAHGPGHDNEKNTPENEVAAHESTDARHKMNHGEAPGDKKNPAEHENSKHQKRETASAEVQPQKTVSKDEVHKANIEPVKVDPELTAQVSKSGAANFTIQIAAFSSSEEADKRVNELKALKLEAFAIEANVKGTTWYRVNVGMYPTIKEAQKQIASVGEIAKIKAPIIQKLRK